MKKSVIVFGSQGSGKTDVSNNFLLNFQESFTRMDFKKFKLSSKNRIKKKYNVIAIDEITSIDQLEYIVNIQNSHELLFVLTSQMKPKNFSLNLLSSFHVASASY